MAKGSGSGGGGGGRGGGRVGGAGSREANRRLVGQMTSAGISNSNARFRFSTPAGNVTVRPAFGGVNVYRGNSRERITSYRADDPALERWVNNPDVRYLGRE